MASNIEPHGYLRRVLSPDERVITIARQHAIFLFWRMFIWLVLSAVIVAIVGAVFLTAPGGVFGLYGLALLVFPLFVLWWQYLVWSNHSYVVTNRRVMQLSGVFNKEVIDSLLEKLNDIKTHQSFVGQIFGYGDVVILTANEDANNTFSNIARPLQFKTAMLQAKRALEQEGIRQ
jgi:uncharacterized membrane protein YdbT with pleckstrin-like domain